MRHPSGRYLLQKLRQCGRVSHTAVHRCDGADFQRARINPQGHLALLVPTDGAVVGRLPIQARHAQQALNHTQAWLQSPSKQAFDAPTNGIVASEKISQKSIFHHHVWAMVYCLRLKSSVKKHASAACWAFALWQRCTPFHIKMFNTCPRMIFSFSAQFFLLNPMYFARQPLGWLTAALACLSLASPACAEKADRYKPLNVAADRQGTLDMVKKTAVFSGNVIITKGSIVIEADRVEVRELPNGSRHMVAYSNKTRQATFRQKRDQPKESVFGKADQLEYDEKTDTVRFMSRAVAQRLIAGRVVDEIAGDVLVYDNQAEVFSAVGQPASSGAGDGRVRVILTPHEAEPGPDKPAAPPPTPEPSGNRP